MEFNGNDPSTAPQAGDSDPLQIADLVRRMLVQIGEEPERQGLLKTPERVSQAMAYLTSGYRSSVAEAINGAIFEEKYDEMVIVKNIEFYSLCEHHLLPFFGVVHVGYIPNGKVLGISKLPRLVEVFARRLQLQERMTQQIAQSLMEFLEPLGVGVVVEAQHLCMMMRGVQKERSRALTSAMLGSFRKSQQTRSEFLSLIGHSSLK